jgi:LPS export ABC transporter protein LptC
MLRQLTAPCTLNGTRNVAPGTRHARLIVCLLILTASCGEPGVTPIQSNVAADSADQILEGMTTKITKEGVVQSTVIADTAYMYSDRQMADLRVLRTIFSDAQGNQTAVLTAKRGEYYITRGTLEAWDSVFVRTLDGTNKTLRTNHLIYDRDRNEIRSDSAFHYESPTEVLRGNAFRSDPNFRNVVTQQPRGRQKGAGLPLEERNP